MIKQEPVGPALCRALRPARSKARGSDGNQADAASGDVRHEKAARSLWRAPGLRALSIRPSDRRRVKLQS